jgi:hypothetical protein
MSQISMNNSLRRQLVLFSHSEREGGGREIEREWERERGWRENLRESLRSKSRHEMYAKVKQWTRYKAT